MPRRKQLNPQPVKLDSEDGVAAADPASFVLESDFLLGRHLQFDENDTEPQILEPERGAEGDTADLIGLEDFPLCFTPLSMEADHAHDPESDPEEGGGACTHCGQLLSLAGPYCPRCGGRGKGWGGRSDPAPPVNDDDDDDDDVEEEEEDSLQEGAGGPPRLHCCTLCGFSSRYSNHLKRHMKTHNGEKPYRCPLCAYASAQLVNLQRHLRIHTGEKPYGCAHCAFACSSLGNLKRHQRMHLQEPRVPMPEQRGSVQEPRGNSAEPRVPMPEQRGNMQEPRMQTAEPCMQMPEPRMQTAEPRMQTAEPRMQMPEPRVSMPEHRSNTAEPRSNMAEQCRNMQEQGSNAAEPRTNSSVPRNRHVKGQPAAEGPAESSQRSYRHGDPPNRGTDPPRDAGCVAGGVADPLPELQFSFTCRLCGAVLEDEDGTSAQICGGCTLELLSKPSPGGLGEREGGGRVFTCALCPFSTQYPNHLARHMKTHSGEKPYKCPQCDYASAHFDNLKRHHRVHTGEKPYRCHLCDYACGNLANLKRHQRIHSGAKPFQCAVCSYSCNQSMNLKRHMLRHTGEKPYGCQECPYTTGHWDNYKRHQRKHGHGADARGWVKVQLPGDHEQEEEEEDEEEEEEEDV